MMKTNRIKNVPLKIAITVVSILICVLLLDFGVGKLFDKLLTKLPSEGERVAKSHYVLNKVKSDIVIIGSSRAECHYDSFLIRDSIPEKSVFNCGVDGSLFFYQVAVLNCIMDRYSPELIIWDLQLEELKVDKAQENLGLLYPYYWKNKYIKDLLDEKEPNLKYMIWLNSYRYNATGSRILRSLGLSESNKMGFGGQKAVDASRNIEFDTVKVGKATLDTKKVKLLESTIVRARNCGAKLVIVQSPYYNQFIGSSSTTDKLKELCNSYNIPFFDNTQLPEFVGDSDYIYDAGHLNINGARLFTERFLKQLKEVGAIKV